MKTGARALITLFILLAAWQIGVWITGVEFFILPGPTQFWMKDMQFPLDIIWIGNTGKIVDITKDAKPPAPDTPMWLLPLYSSRLPAKYALEINAGEADSFQLSIGDNVTYN